MEIRTFAAAFSVVVEIAAGCITKLVFFGQNSQMFVVEDKITCEHRTPAQTFRGVEADTEKAKPRCHRPGSASFLKTSCSSPSKLLLPILCSSSFPNIHSFIHLYTHAASAITLYVLQCYCTFPTLLERSCRGPARRYVET